MNISISALSNIGVGSIINGLFACFSRKCITILHIKWQPLDVRNDHGQLVQHSPKALTDGDEDDRRMGSVANDLIVQNGRLKRW